jgi:LuxR family maltose regulon positive regulatory protein
VQQPLFVPRTKLRPPRIPEDVLVRMRLLPKLDGTETLTLVVAPAGYGKTTLVTSWLAQGRHPYAWLSLEGDDNKLGIFVAGLVCAIRRLVPAFGGELLDLVQSESSRQTPAAILYSLFNALDTVERHFVLVLDDYHHIVDNSVHQLLWGLLLHPPRHLHLVLTARHDPPLPPRGRMQGTIHEIRARDLRFQAAEIREFLAQFAVRHLITPQSIAAFTELSEGWAVPLRLMATVMRQRQDVTSLEEALRKCDGFLLDYLEAEVIGQFPVDVQTFLTHTSLLDWLNVSLCDAVLKAACVSVDSAATLRMLVAAGIFVEPLDDSGDWFRYHELFRILLQHRLRRTFSKQLVAALQQSAKDWLEQHGLGPIYACDTSSGTTPSLHTEAAKLLPNTLPIPPIAPYLPPDRTATRIGYARRELLTYREMDVMDLLGQRLTNKEIARALTISCDTVRQHTVSIYRKLGVANRRQAVAKADACGLMTDLRMGEPQQPADTVPPQPQ